ncbi:MAG: 3D-(3,5/4)-trihydroxycyclohexane-1,2-dione acylhydrolase (decyclizing) [Hyphomicrobiaceae bacterium]|nr:MAG: 3D-(3,5/4)-trihydroxycyclohexane-1,2-dione acylhydrolase (decyclizing) [Hyphomicrobiaceae bacterium]
MAQALVRFLAAQRTEIDGKETPLFAGVWAIFGHGNVSGLGEALAEVESSLPTYRAHNEQAMAHAAIAFAKATRRRRMMACTSSIGPGATNMVTAAALAHVNRLPVLLLPGDVYASRRPDPVLQQIEHFGDGTVSANDCFRPVSRHFDRMTRPEQIMPALNRAMGVLTDPAECGPVTLSLCQDVQAEAFDFPAAFFAPRRWQFRRQRPDSNELAEAARLIAASKKPLLIAGGGVPYSLAEAALAAFAERHAVPLAVTQAGKGAIAEDHPQCVGGIGVTGTDAANALAAEADLVLAVGTRLQDFTTASRTLFAHPHRRFIGLNVQPFDAVKHMGIPLVADARTGLEELSQLLGDWRAPEAWEKSSRREKRKWQTALQTALQPANEAMPSDAEVIGAVWRGCANDAVVVGAAGGLPGELHKLWQVRAPGTYHLEYGYSCMGYEIAGALGVKMADPSRHVVVMVGDGSYLMMNSEIASSVMLGLPLTIVLLDNKGFGCIDRLQQACGGRSFNNLLETAAHRALPRIDFAAHARSLGADARKMASLAELQTAVETARKAETTTVLVIETDPAKTSGVGGAWWDVAVPEVSSRAEVAAARSTYEAAIKRQRLGD